MLKRVVAGIAAGLLGITALVAGSPSANAVQLPAKCVIAAPTAVCVSFDVKKQADGTGVVYKGVHIYFTQGCPGEVEANPISSINGSVRDINGGPQTFNYVSPMVDCDAYRTMDLVGPDNGGVSIHVFGDININGGYDYDFYVDCDVKADLTQQNCTKDAYHP